MIFCGSVGGLKQMRQKLERKAEQEGACMQDGDFVGGN
jgi:hypothetical protein